MMRASELNGVIWNKASRSNGNGGNNCVEVAFIDAWVAVRDSKNPSGPALLFPPGGWESFLRHAKDGGFDRGT